MGPDLIRCLVSVAFAQPGGVVAGGEGGQSLSQLLDRGEVANPEELFLERPDRSFGHAVALGLADEGRGAGDAEAPDLGLEVLRHILRAMVVSQDEAGRRVRHGAAEVLRHPLADRLQRQRLALDEAWVPTNSPEQWSTAMKTKARPCSIVTVCGMSVPQT